MNSVTYILYDENVDYVILIDCGQYRTLEPELNRIGKTVKAVFLTHGHFDHIYGLKKLVKDQPEVEVYTTVYGHEELQDAKKNLSFYHEASFIVQNYQVREIQGGNILYFEGLCDIETIFTPGHDASCMTYRIEKNLFTGDAYIPGINVFTKFPKANKRSALESEALLKQMEEDGYNIYCGHHNYNTI